MGPRAAAAALAAIILILSRSASAQSPAMGWRIGTGVGLQRLSGDLEAGTGLGGEVTLGRSLSSHVSATLIAGYANLPFTETSLSPSGLAGPIQREASLFSGEVLFEVAPVNQGSLRPLLGFGAGLIGFRAGDAPRAGYGTGMLAAGVQMQLDPEIALHLRGSYHLVLSDELAGFASGDEAKGYLSARIGLTFFTGARSKAEEEWLREYSEEVLTIDQDASEELDETPAEPGVEITSKSGDSAGQSENTIANEPASAQSSESTWSDLGNEPAESSGAMQKFPTDATPVEAGNAQEPAGVSALEERLRLLEDQIEAAGETEPQSTLNENIGDEPPASFSLAERLRALDERDDESVVPTAGQQPDVWEDELESPEQVGFPSLEDRLQVSESQTGSSNDADQDYTRIQSQINEINDALAEKDDEISSLRDELFQESPAIPAADAQASSDLASFSPAYESALNSFYQLRYQETVAKFSELIEKFPTHALVSNCYYWIGEAEYAARDYPAAVEAFNRVLEFSLSIKKDNALLMLGQCYLKLQRPAEARKAFSRLIMEYPTSEAAAKAEEKLNQL